MVVYVLTFQGPVPVSSLMLRNIRFVQHGFTDRPIFEERVPSIGLVLQMQLQRFDASSVYIKAVT
jgi:hypothetical protein